MEEKGPHPNEEHDTGTATRAFLIDTGTMTVVWMNEPAARMIASRGVEPVTGMPVGDVVPIAAGTEVSDAVREVASTGLEQHLLADLVSTGIGTMSIVTSIHRLPDRAVLILAEQAWRSDRGASRGAGRRTR